MGEAPPIPQPFSFCRREDFVEEQGFSPSLRGRSREYSSLPEAGAQRSEAPQNRPTASNQKPAVMNANYNSAQRGTNHQSTNLNFYSDAKGVCL